MFDRFLGRLCWGVHAGLLLSGGFFIAGCAGSQEPVSGSFVGETSDPVTSVAVVAAEPDQGEDSREVRALIYGERENPIAINEWFVGSAAGNDLELTSEGGAQLEGELAPDGATGTITLPDGTSVPFDTVPATGVAGFYNVTISPEGQADGTSENGARLEGVLQDEQASQIPGETREHSVVPLVGTITPPEGQPQDFEVSFLRVPVQEPGEALNARFIVSPDGTIRGGARKGSGSQFTCPLID